MVDWGAAPGDEGERGRTHREEVFSRRNKRRDWVRKGGLFVPVIWLGLVAVMILTFAVANLADSGSFSGGSTTLRTLAAAVAGVGIIAAYCVAVARVLPRAVHPEEFAHVAARALADGLVEMEKAPGEPFNRRVVAGQLGDGHRTIAFWAPAPEQRAPSVTIHGVSKTPMEEHFIEKKKEKLRLAEIVYVVWTGHLDTFLERAIVATPPDDPASPLEPADSTARRFESNRFNGAYRVLSDDRRRAHVVFDPVLLETLLELRDRRIRLLWEGDIAYVACELDLADDDVFDRVPWILGRMRRNATLTIPWEPGQ